MKVLDLQCHNQHVFEGWFASEADFVSQRERALVLCPLCGDKAVHKKPSAPRLNLGATERPPTATDSDNATSPQLQTEWLALAKRVVAQTEDVGENFAQEARKIHYGQAQERGIRGQATRAEAESLREEGINVATLPLPESLKGRVH